MYKIGDYVVYSTIGVCKIADIKTEEFYGEDKTYYIIENAFGNKSVVHIPTDNDILMAKLRKPHTKSELKDMIKLVGKEKVEWISEYKIRSETYSAALKSGIFVEILKVLKAAYINEKECLAVNKKISMTDKRITDTAEKLLFEELSVVQGITFEEAKEMLTEKLGI